MDFAPPRGTADILPPESDEFLALELAAHELARVHGFRYVDTPAFENTELFARTSGESSDIVIKEMYTFEDKGGRSLTLRPEGTAPLVRAWLEKQQVLGSPFKAYYLFHMWRHGRPQAGRLREFRQFGIEVIASDAPEADVEVIVIADRFLRDRGLSNVTLLINSIGDEVCRPAYRTILVAFLEQHRDGLCKECRERIDTNPMRTFDCKEEQCRDIMKSAPVITDHLCDECREHFAGVQAGLREEGVPFKIDERLVRGLDYYTRTAFEFVADVLGGQQGTVCGGGRYDGLAEALGGPATPGIGFGLGLERTLLAMRGEGVAMPPARVPAVFVVALGEAARAAAADVVRSSRANGIAAVTSYDERPLKAQLRMADRSGAAYAAIIGERDISDGVATLRRLEDGVQESVGLEKVAEWISQHI